MNTVPKNNLRVYNNVIEAIGWTPLIKMGKIFPNHNVMLKAEFMNPGGSIKDRIGFHMLLKAEEQGLIKPGQTIIEPSSGNTGIGLAIACCLKNYPLIVTMPDKMSYEKAQALEAFGVKVVWCPTAVEKDDPRSYYSVANRIAKEQNGWVPNQYSNKANPEAHYLMTGPEIWEQTKGKITYFVASLGTGGTISGVGRYLKEQNSDIRIVGVDAMGSILKEAHQHPNHEYNTKNIHTYKMEGIGEDFIPESMNLDIIDEIITVNDQEGFLMTREVVKKEALMIGGSAGAAVYAIKQELLPQLNSDDLVVVITPDGSRPYLNKIFNESWMKENEFLS